MKATRALLSFLAAMFVYLLYLPTRVFAQVALPAAPAPAPAGIDWGLVIVVLAIVALIGFFVLKRKNPEIAEKLTDLLHKKEETHAALVATNATLANVVASPPVQAVVNSAAQNAPGAPLAPAPVPTQQPAAAQAPAAAFLPYGTLIQSGPGRGNYADGKGGFYLANEPTHGNPDYKEGDHLPGWSQAGEELAAAFLASKTPEEQQAANEKIAAFIGFPGADFSTGTAANTAAANFWRANNPHQ